MGTADSSSPAEQPVVAKPTRYSIDDPVLNMGLVNENARAFMEELAKKYPDRTSINVGQLSAYPADNKAETIQNRLGLNNQRSESLAVFDLDGKHPVDWSNSNAVPSDASCVMAIDRTHLSNSEAPAVLYLNSNTHVLNDTLSIGTNEKLAEKGIVFAAIDYPGYGGSLGEPSRAHWNSATAKAAEFLHGLTGRKVHLVGHSIGIGPAFEAAAESSDHIAGILSYGGFSSMLEMTKDQKNFGIPGMGKIIGPLMAKLTWRKELFDPMKVMDEVAANDVPVLAMHGTRDGSVPLRHLDILQKRMAEVSEENTSASLKAVKIDAGHEDIQNVGSREFDQIWDAFSDFMRSKS